MGAALPAHSAHSTTRDVARLKGNLLKGSSSSLKRSRDEYLSGAGLSSSSNQIASKDDSEDEEDSRAGMIRSSSVKEKPVHSVHSRLAIFEGKGKKTKKKGKPSGLDVEFAVPLHPPSQNASSSQKASYRTPSNSPSPIRHLKSTSPISPLSPTIRAFPSAFDPEQSLPLSTDVSVASTSAVPLSPSHKHKDSVIEPYLTSSTMISSADVTETDTDDPRDLEIKDIGQGSGLTQVQTASSGKRKRRRKNKDKNKNSLADGQRTDTQEEVQRGG